MNTQQSPERERLFAVVSHGLATGMITTSRLMSPPELTAVARGRPDLHGRVEGWFLCTEVPEEMWQRALEARVELAPTTLTVVDLGSRRKYLSVVLQMGDWQHRICVPLVGQLTTQWLETLVSGVSLQMSVASPKSERVFLSVTEVPHVAIAALRDADTSIPEDWRGLIEEAMQVMAWNSCAAEVERCDKVPEPREVSLSLLFPAEVEAVLLRRAEAAAGRNVS